MKKTKFEELSVGELKNKIFCCPTDTIYGLSALVHDKEAIDRIRELKGRGKDQGFIVLISSIDTLSTFGISLDNRHLQFLNKIWPGPVTVAFDLNNDDYTYLSGKFSSLAFRLPADAVLRDFIDRVGPIVSSSANKHGFEVVKNIEEAIDLFADDVDYYIDADDLSGKGSVIVKILR